MSIFGHIPGVRVGASFATRADAVAVARNAQSGMVGGAGGTESIVLNGGYVDDVDLGSFVVYTGQGGQSETRPKVQVQDQVLQRGNLGLKTSYELGLPVRVIRGYKGDPVYSPAQGYRYDGLYKVTDFATGASNGYLIYQATLEPISGEVNLELAAPNATDSSRSSAGVGPAPYGNTAPGLSTRLATTVERGRAVVAWVKNIYGDTCQLCGFTLTVPGGTSSAGAHIRPLGRPHAGPDTTDNILCLCHNCHFLFDHGGVVVADDLSIYVHSERTTPRKLHVEPPHEVNGHYLEYHRRQRSWFTPR